MSEQKDGERPIELDGAYGCLNDYFLDSLTHRVPDEVVFGLDTSTKQKSKDDKVAIDNDRAVLAIIKAYADNEMERVKRQKWLLIAVVFLAACQLIFFNRIIYQTVLQSIELAKMEMVNGDIVQNLFNILKYYIGATVVELIGMIVFITKGTFTSDHVKTMELVLKGKTIKGE